MENVALKPMSRGVTINWADQRVQWLGAILLAAIAGYVDGYGLLFLKTYVSFMSGNTTSTGVTSGEGQFHAAFLSALAIVSFVTGSFLGNLLSQSRWRHCHRMMFFLIAAGLAVVTALEWARLRSIPLEVTVLAVTMGMVNPVLSKVGVEAVSLTFMTGTLSRIGGHLALAAAQQPLNDQQGPGDSHLGRAGIEASVWFGFLGGAVLAGFAGSNIRPWALLPPFIVILLLGLVSECSAPAKLRSRSSVEAELPMENRVLAVTCPEYLLEKETAMADQNTKKCAHIPCLCDVPQGQDYCGEACRDAGSEDVEIACQCDHPACPLN